MPQGTNRTAALILKPVFTARRIGTPSVIYWKRDSLKAEELDVRETEIVLGDEWTIDINCTYNNGVQTAKSAITLTPTHPSRQGRHGPLSMTESGCV